MSPQAADQQGASNSVHPFACIAAVPFTPYIEKEEGDSRKEGMEWEARIWKQLADNQNWGGGVRDCIWHAISDARRFGPALGVITEIKNNSLNLELFYTRHGRNSMITGIIVFNVDWPNLDLLHNCTSNIHETYVSTPAS